MAPPGREPGHEDPAAVDAELRRQRARHPGDDRRLPGAAPLVPRPEPVPAAVRIVHRRLPRIRDQQPMRLRQRVHPRPGREVLGILPAPVQHDHEPPEPPATPGGRDIEPIVPRPRRAGVPPRQERRPVRHLRRRRHPPPLPQGAQHLPEAPPRRRLDHLRLRIEPRPRHRPPRLRRLPGQRRPDDPRRPRRLPRPGRRHRAPQRLHEAPAQGEGPRPASRPAQAPSAASSFAWNSS